MTDRQRAPAGLGKRGKALWAAVTAEFSLDVREQAQLEDASRTADLIDRLQAKIDADGVMTDAYGGRVHPAATEIRQQRLALARLLVALRVPAGEEDGIVVVGGGRSQRRAIRGVYRTQKP